MRVLIRSVAVVMLVAGCGDDGPTEADRTDAMQRPSVRGVGPELIAVGETLTIFGENFIDPKRGETRVVFEGTFESTGGESNSAEVEVGDLIVTSGMGRVFPAGRPVAVISEFTERPDQEFAVVTARPVSELDRDQEVLLVWPDDRIGLDEAEAVVREGGQ